MDRLSKLLQFLDEDPGDAFTRFALAREYQKLGQVEKAVPVFEKLVRDQPAYIGTYYHLGKLYLTLDQKAHAVEIFRKGIAEAQKQRDMHALSELQDALMQAEGIGFDD